MALAGTNTLANGDQFAIRVWTNAQGWVVVQSTGIANPGTALEAQRQVTVEFMDRGQTPDQTGNTDFYNEDGSFNADAWGISGGLTPTPKDTGPSGGEGALDIKGTDGYLYLTWGANTNTLARRSPRCGGPIAPRPTCWATTCRSKSSPTTTRRGLWPALSARHFVPLQANGACYGLSFFRSLPVSADNQRPAWARDARLDVNFRICAARTTTWCCGIARRPTPSSS
jgi:hypothetical protein